MYFLMIKTHKDTGLKYLCMTQRKNPFKYLGSGTYWRQHLKKHGEAVHTEVVGVFETEKELKEVSIPLSEKLNVVESKEWANLRPEEGTGGNTSNTEGWKKGMKNRRSYVGKNNPNYGKVGSWAGKVGPQLGKRWANNGVEERAFIDEIPEGWSEGRLSFTCEHCNKTMNNLNYKRWHGDKCKSAK